MGCLERSSATVFPAPTAKPTPGQPGLLATTSPLWHKALPASTPPWPRHHAPQAAAAPTNAKPFAGIYVQPFPQQIAEYGRSHVWQRHTELSGIGTPPI